MRKSKFKRLLSILLILALAIPTMAMPVTADPVSVAGTAGDFFDGTDNAKSVKITKIPVGNGLELSDGSYNVFCINSEVSYTKGSKTFKAASTSSQASIGKIVFIANDYYDNTYGYSETQHVIWSYSNPVAGQKYQYKELVSGKVKVQTLSSAEQALRNKADAAKIPQVDAASYKYATFTVDGGSSNQTLLMLVPEYTIGDKVWLDTDNDDVQSKDFSDPGVANITVRLWDENGYKEMATAQTTDANGKYTFSHLKAGNYKVEFVLPSNGAYEFVKKEQGSGKGKDNYDSDANLNQGQGGNTKIGWTAAIKVGPSTESIDAGLKHVQGAAVTVDYKDKVTYAKIADTVSLTGNIGDSINPTQKVITDYVYDSVLPNSTGTFTSTAQTITYYYTKAQGKVTVNYMDGTKLLGTYEIGGDVGKTYDAVSNYTNPDYVLVDPLPTNKTGKITAAPIVVTYNYTKAPAKVTVQYLEGSKVLGGYEITGTVGKAYEAPSKFNDSSYALVGSAPANATGNMTLTPIVVTYNYAKVQGKVTVNYMDGKTLLGTYEIGGNVGTPYNAVSKFTNPDYVLVDPTPTNVQGNITVDPIVVTYNYEKRQVTFTSSVFNDQDNDGYWDDILKVLKTEPAVGDLNVTLTVGDKETTKKTDGNGDYTFDVPVNTPFAISVAKPKWSGDVTCTTGNQTMDFSGISKNTSGNFALVGFYESFKAYANVTVFYDLNNDGDMDVTGDPNTNETLIPNVTITDDGAYDFENGSTLKTIQPGSLRVEVSGLPTDKEYVLHSSQENPSTMSIKHNDTVNFMFGYHERIYTEGDVTGSVFFDKNKDTEWNISDPAVDTDEKGLSGVTVSITDEEGNAVKGFDDVATDADGSFSFKSLPAGTYTLTYAAPTDKYEVTTPVEFTGTQTVTVVLGDTVEAEDVGYWAEAEPTVINGTVYDDAAPVGTIDATDIGLAGVIVKLMSSDVEVNTATTDSDGKYSFTVESAGDYTLEFTAPKFYSQTVPNDDLDGSVAVTAVAEQSTEALDVAYTKEATGWIEIKVQELKDSVATLIDGIDVAITGSGDAPYTSTGTSDFKVEVPVGTYSAAVTDAGKALLTDGKYQLTVGSENGYENSDIYSEFTVAVGETVTRIMDYFRTVEPNVDLFVFLDANKDGAYGDGENGFEKQVVQIYKAIPTDGAPQYELASDIIVTDKGDGHYTAFVNDNGQYKIEITAPAGYDLTTADNESQEFYVGEGEPTLTDIGYSETVVPNNVEGHVYLDTNTIGTNDSDAGLSGIVLEAYRSVEGEWVTTEARATTNDSGYYGFNLVDGTFQVRVVDGTGTKELSYGSADNDVVFPEEGSASIADIGYKTTGGGGGGGDDTPKYATVMGRVYDDINGNGTRDDGEMGLNSVEISIKDVSGEKSKITDGNGKFEQIVDLGSVTIEVSRAPVGYVLTTGNATQTRTISTAKAEVEFNEIGYYVPPKEGNIQGVVFNDANSNGVKDTNEVGIPNVTVTVTVGTATKTAVTNTSGVYTFMNLPEGPVKISVDTATVPADYSTSTNNESQTAVIIDDQMVTAADMGYKQDVTTTTTRRHHNNTTTATTTTIPAEETPQGLPVIPEAPAVVVTKQEAPAVLLPEEVIPQGLPVLPKTGETSSLFYYLLGLGLMGAGVLNLRKKEAN